MIIDMKVQQLIKKWDIHTDYSYYLIKDEKIVGHFDFEVCDEYISLVNLYVDEYYQKQGFGTEMLKYAINRFLSNYPEISEEISKFNCINIKVRKDSWMVKWYEKHGFKYHSEAQNIGQFEFIWMVLYR
jgi:ribosomal protein S18 acetylase RimI-like enzyme